MNTSKTKTILFHLGTYKTATTFLQYVLWHHFKDPDGQLYYPGTGTYGNAHHYLPSPEFPGWMNGVTQPEFESVWEKFLTDIDRSPADIVIISSEMFCSLFENDISFIQKMLGAYSLRAIIYLRPQDQFISSLASQLIKGCNFKPEYYTHLDKAIHKIMTDSRFDYGTMCTRWSRAVGEKNLIIRPFDPKQFHEGNILSDFFHHSFGMPVPAFLNLPSKKLNPRLCRDALEFKQLVNRMPIDRDTMNATLPGLLAYSRATDAKTQDVHQEHLLLSPSRRMEIMERYAKTNAHIARTYLGRADGRLFSDSMIDPSTEWTDYPGLNPEKLAHILQFLNKITPEILSLLIQAAQTADTADRYLHWFLTGLKAYSDFQAPGQTDVIH